MMKGSDVFAVMLLIGLIGGGVFVGYMFGVMRVGDFPPTSHKIIAEQISAENVPYQIDCKLEYVRSDNAVPMDVYEIGPASSANFSYATNYPCSEWRFTINGDTTGYMKIYGPDNEGSVYYIGIVSFSMHHFKVTTPLESVTLNVDNARYDTILTLVPSS